MRLNHRIMVWLDLHLDFVWYTVVVAVIIFVVSFITRFLPLHEYWTMN